MNKFEGLIKYDFKLEEYNEIAKVTIFPCIQEVLNDGWDSLRYSDNFTTFAVATIGDFNVRLTTSGEVKIEYKDEILTNKDSIKIADLIKQDKLDDEMIFSNNWFSMQYSVLLSEGEEGTVYELYDDDVFECEPKDIESFKSFFEDWIIFYYKDYVALGYDEKEEGTCNE